jgi:fatty acid desaturase
VLHYYFLSRQKVLLIIVGIMIASCYIAVVVFGNHEREWRYRLSFLDDFLQQQLVATTDYSWGWDGLEVTLGGFEHHAEHHLFPRIPFYYLKEAKKVIEEELLLSNKEVKVSPIL